MLFNLFIYYSKKKKKNAVRAEMAQRVRDRGVEGGTWYQKSLM
jgi:hypothetical protein